MKSLTHLTRIQWLLMSLLTIGSPQGQAADDPLRWEAEVREFEAADKKHPPPPHPILFTGSSSIRLWKNLQESFAGMNVLGRGIGGSQMSELNHYIDRLVLAYQPKQVLVYEGDNDIASGKTPQQVLTDFRFFVDRVHGQRPGTRISYIAIKPSKARWHLLDSVRKTNRLIRNYARWARHVEFIDVYSPMLQPDGRLREELFAPDGLHLNPKGYAVWAEVIRRRL